ncbi:MAG TPA: hypothetical protein VLJ37_11645 [bacterium]|nr:hypothetical protein [bacterium]
MSYLALQMTYSGQSLDILQPCSQILIGSASLVKTWAGPDRITVQMNHVHESAFRLLRNDRIWWISPLSPSTSGRLRTLSSESQEQMIMMLDLQTDSAGREPEERRRVEEVSAKMEQGAYALFFGQERIDFFVPREDHLVLSPGANCSVE